MFQIQTLQFDIYGGEGGITSEANFFSGIPEKQNVSFKNHHIKLNFGQKLTFFFNKISKANFFANSSAPHPPINIKWSLPKCEGRSRRGHHCEVQRQQSQKDLDCHSIYCNSGPYTLRPLLSASTYFTSCTLYLPC